jgi:hypothetical protein
MRRRGFEFRESEADGAAFIVGAATPDPISLPSTLDAIRRAALLAVQ